MHRMALTCALAGLAMVACASAYHMDPPPAFRAYEESKDPKWITSDGVMLKVRRVDNYPKADLQFWVEAMREHMLRQGYAATPTQCFRTTNKLDGCRVDFVLPNGSEDWVMSETLFVVDEDVHLVEAAGPYARFNKVEGELQQALVSFRVGSH
jgi:hypothetical protein